MTENPLEGMTDEQLKALGQEMGIEITPPDDEIPPRPPSLTRASDLISEVAEPAELGFTPDGKYKGYRVVEIPVQDERHAYLFDPATAPSGRVRAFYVQADDESKTIGLVPWEGSTVVWPWEVAWTQDMYHDRSRDAIRKAFVEAQKKKQK